VKTWRPFRFPPLARPMAEPLASDSSVELQASLAEGYQQGMDNGYQDGYEAGMAEGRRNGLKMGRAEGHAQGEVEAHHAAQARIDTLVAPLEAIFDALKALQDDYHSALRQEVVELVAKVARQVIRCELALQPVQLLALVDETLASLPPATDAEVTVYLNPEECQRIRELAPERAARWNLVPEASLEPGECRVRAGNHEADAGCRQRLDACIEQVAAQLTDSEAEQPA
jgi:flagellar assembly protein FliH